MWQLISTKQDVQITIFTEYLRSNFTSVQCFCLCMQLPKVNYRHEFGATNLINNCFLTSEKKGQN